MSAIGERTGRRADLTSRAVSERRGCHGESEKLCEELDDPSDAPAGIGLGRRAAEGHSLPQVFESFTSTFFLLHA